MRLLGERLVLPRQLERRAHVVEQRAGILVLLDRRAHVARLLGDALRVRGVVPESGAGDLVVELFELGFLLLDMQVRARVVHAARRLLKLFDFLISHFVSHRKVSVQGSFATSAQGWMQWSFVEPARSAETPRVAISRGRRVQRARIKQAL